ncbi:hypothetical protein PHK61_16860 [Actinomycetospora lutea]|uniref:hypothetical protein n=1 Tax=Actinomycetospora lutea TaxID=663604 RepID=UPI002365C7E4|nr:hypothetical protein [Actinomycetospora lutea]MDD7940094.1 hypothetical protein [Actinomycetospora lutea]
MSAPTAELAALEEHLAAVLAGLGAPPADRDPLLWAAHEAALCARELLALRTGGGDADWASVLASARASMAAVSYARRETGALPGA